MGRDETGCVFGPGVGMGLGLWVDILGGWRYEGGQMGIYVSDLLAKFGLAYKYIYIYQRQTWRKTRRRIFRGRLEKGSTIPSSMTSSFLRETAWQHSGSKIVGIYCLRLMLRWSSRSERNAYHDPRFHLFLCKTTDEERTITQRRV